MASPAYKTYSLDAPPEEYHVICMADGEGYMRVNRYYYLEQMLDDLCAKRVSGELRIRRCRDNRTVAFNLAGDPMAIDYKAMREMLQKGLGNIGAEYDQRNNMFNQPERYQTATEIKARMSEAVQAGWRAQYDYATDQMIYRRDPKNYSYGQVVDDGLYARRLEAIGMPLDSVFAIKEEEKPSPRAELEQRCLDKGLDPNFARELDLD